MAEQLRRLNDNVAAIRAAVGGGAAAVVGGRGGGGAGWSSGSGRLVLLGVLAGVSAAGLVYLRSQAGRGQGGGGGGGALGWLLPSARA